MCCPQPIRFWKGIIEVSLSPVHHQENTLENPSGNFTMFSPLGGQPKEHFITFPPLEATQDISSSHFHPWKGNLEDTLSCFFFHWMGTLEVSLSCFHHKKVTLVGTFSSFPIQKGNLEGTSLCSYLPQGHLRHFCCLFSNMGPPGPIAPPAPPQSTSGTTASF